MEIKEWQASNSKIKSEDKDIQQREKENIFQQMVLGIHMEKKKNLDLPNLKLYTKINSKQIVHLNMKGKIITLLKENIKGLHDLGEADIFKVGHKEH